MPDHRIRLRGGWEWENADEFPGAPARLTLPIVWPRDLVGLVRLARWFQRPPLDPAHETLHLDFEDVPRLLGVWLNGGALVRPVPGVSELRVPLGAPLPVRNRIVLEVALPTEDAGAGLWGEIRLIIESEGTADDPDRALLGGSDEPG